MPGKIRWLSTPETGLPVLKVFTVDESRITSKDDWIPATAYLSVDSGSGTKDTELGALEIRGRGNTSWNYPKKPYVMRFTEELSFFGSYPERIWVLLANYRDKTLLRNDLAFEISRRTGLAWTPESFYVELMVNGEYLGNYQLTDQVEVSPNRVDIDEPNGYLFELDTYRDNDWRLKSPRFDLPVNIKAPDDMNQLKLIFLGAYFEELEAAVAEPAPSGTSGRYTEYIDADSFADWYLVNELMCNGEANHPKSVFMSLAGRPGSRLIMGPVWDFDWSTCVHPNGFRLRSAFWFRNLFQDPDFKARVKTRWEVLKDKLDGDSVLPSLDEYIRERGRYLEASQQLNTERWNLEDVDLIGRNYGSYDAYLEALRGYFSERISWLDEKIRKW